jgi:hypothetical protein
MFEIAVIRIVVHSGFVQCLPHLDQDLEQTEVDRSPLIE